MALGNEENKPVEEPVIDELDKEVEGDGAEKKPVKDVKFDDLPPEIQRFIDQERTRASNTAREKAKREAVKDPEIQKSVREALEEEARLTVEEKAQRQMAEIARRENRLDARERLQEAGVSGDHLQDILSLVVSDDHDVTLAQTDKFVEMFTSSVALATEAKTRELIKGTPKPKSGGSSVKEYKDMSYAERLKLKAEDPSRYKTESEKLRKKI